MPPELAPGSTKLARFSGTCSRGSSVAEGSCAAGQEDILAHVAAERHVSGRRARPVLRGLTRGSATHGVRRARVDGAVAVEVPAVQDGLDHGFPAVEVLADRREVVTKVEVERVPAVGHVLHQLRVHELEEISAAGVVVDDGPGEGVVEVPLDVPPAPVQLRLQRVVVVGVRLGIVDDIADAGL